MIDLFIHSFVIDKIMINHYLKIIMKGMVNVQVFDLREKRMNKKRITERELKHYLYKVN